MFEKTITFLVFAIATSRKAHAYLDPGTGSMLFQLVSALLLTGVVTMRIWVKAVKNFFSRKPKDKPVNDGQQDFK